MARRSQDPAAWMRPRSAQIESLNRRLVRRPAGDGTQDEHLVQAHLSVKDISARQSEASLQIERRKRLALDYNRTNVRTILLDHIEDSFGVRLALLVPRRSPQSVGRILQ